MSLLRPLRLLLGAATAAASLLAPGAAAAESAPRTRNLFAELLGKPEAEIDAKLDAAWRHFFEGDKDTARLYFPAADGTAYIADIGSHDVRTEGLSYGMMICVQLDRRAEFDALWRWSVAHLRHKDGPRAGYFAWHAKFDGTPLDPGSASDGEEWYAMALLFASHRWGDAGAVNYGAAAQALLREMLHKPGTPEVAAIFNRVQRQVVFAPTPEGARFTDPSYHLPAFYQLWARWADNPGDRRYWGECADISRAFWHRTAHPQTGLMPDYAHFDGRPHTAFQADKGDFRYDAWRTLGNVGLDHAWWKSDPWQVEQSNRVLKFFLSQGDRLANQYKLDGTPLTDHPSAGQLAMAAVAGQAADPELARPFVQRLWDAAPPSGQWRYYDGMLYFLALLQTSGRFQAFPPPAP